MNHLFFAEQKINNCNLYCIPKNKVKQKNNGNLPTWQGRARASETRLSSPNFPNFYTNFRSQVVLLYPRPCKGPIQKGAQPCGGAAGAPGVRMCAYEGHETGQISRISSDQCSEVSPGHSLRNLNCISLGYIGIFFSFSILLFIIF